MKKKGIILITLGVLGAIFILLFDIILGKPVYDISGPKSKAGFVISGLLIIIGFSLLKKQGK